MILTDESYEDEDFIYQCDYGFDEEDLAAIEGRKLCPLHMPNYALKITQKNDEKSIGVFVEKILNTIRVSQENNEPALFAGVTFHEEIDLDFLLNHLDVSLRFYKCTFHCDVDFSNEIIPEHIFFDFSEFKRDSKFINTIFLGMASFDGATFNSYAWFEKSKFYSFSSFNNATFKQALHYVNTIFYEEADFHNSHFMPAYDSYFPKEKSDKNLPLSLFEDAKFFDHVSFDDRVFLGSADFSNCYFEKAPSFHNCAFHQDTDFSGSIFLDTSGRGAEKAYRTLKLAMENNRDRFNQAKFYALEQRSLRNHSDTPLPAKIFSQAYEAASDYGQSFLKPFLWLVWFTIIFFWIYANLLIPSGIDHLDKSFVFTMEQIVRPFIVWTTQYAEKTNAVVRAGLEANPVALKLTATIQSLISLGLVTLFILAVRRRFKMD